MFAVKLHFLFLTPWIILSIPEKVFAGFELPVMLIVLVIGLLGTFAKRLTLTTAASLSLIVFLVGGKVGTDLAGAPNPDTAVLIAQFLAVIFFMEGSRVVLSFEKGTISLAGRKDDLSHATRLRFEHWARGQLAAQSKLMMGALGISLALLVFGGLSSVSVDQLAFLGVLVLLVVGVLLFLLTQTREPESRTS